MEEGKLVRAGDVLFTIKSTDYNLQEEQVQKVNLSNGMTVEARITYDEVTYFDYVLEKLGLLVK